MSFLLSCGGKTDKDENVVQNQLEPQKIGEKLTELILEEKFTIDTENDAVAEIGLTNIFDIEVDSEGNIYLLNRNTNDNLIFKFDKNGDFLTSFGKRGQGPGEIERPTYISINSKDEIITIGSRNIQRVLLLLFDKEGVLIKKIPMPIKGSVSQFFQMKNNNFVLEYYRSLQNNKEFFGETCISLFNPQGKEIKNIGRYKKQNMNVIQRVSGIPNQFVWNASSEHIYFGETEKGYEISVFDESGNLFRNITKKYKPVEVFEEYKKSLLNSLENPESRKKVYFPKYMSAFRYFYPDDEGRLFIMTWERGENLREFTFDIFNPEGQFIGRKRINTSAIIKVRGGHLYSIRIKDSGFKELVVYKMIWR